MRRCCLHIAAAGLLLSSCSIEAKYNAPLEEEGISPIDTIPAVADARSKATDLLANLSDRSAWYPAQAVFDSAGAGRYIDSVQNVCAAETSGARLARRHYYERIDGPDELTFLFVAPSKCGDYAIIFTYLIDGDSVWFGNFNRFQPATYPVTPFFP